MPPPGVPAVAMPGRRGRLAGVAVQPPVDPVRVHLLAPDQPGAGLAQHPHRLGADVRGGDRRVELVGFPLPGGHDVVEVESDQPAGGCGLVRGPAGAAAAAARPDLRPAR